MIDTSTKMRWMANNLLEAGVNSIEVTSENADHPMENMLDPSQRTKTFKFAGRFLVEVDVNDKLYINGSTYTIPEGNYNGLTALLAAINVQTVSVATFSVKSGTKIVQVSDADGLTLNLSNQTEALWETIGFTGNVNVVVPASTQQEADEARIHWPYDEISVDFGYQATIGFVAMIGDLSSEVKIPEGALVTIMGNNVNSFASPPLNQTIPWYKTGVMKFIDDIEDSSWRYVKVRIECPTAAFLPEIGYLYLGEYEKFPEERNVNTGIGVGFEDASELSSADSGAIYGNDRTPNRVFRSLQIGLARPIQSAFLKRKYALKQRTKPFFVALDPKMFLSSTFDEHLAFVRFTASPDYTHILGNRFQLSFELREAL